MPSLAAFLAIFCGTQVGAASRTTAALPADGQTYAHSHNDYAQPHPLFDALDHHLASVEADIWLSAGRPMVSHLGWFYKGSLEDMYLAPLQKLVDQRGSVYGDGRPFYLWIDIKERTPLLRRELNEVLNRYSMLTVFSDDGTGDAKDGTRDIAKDSANASASTSKDATHTQPGAVTVILTGNAESKQKFVEEYPVRRACRDAEAFNENDPPADQKWRWYAMPWSSWMRDESALRKMVSKIHAKGRKIRLYAVPQLEEIWRGAIGARVDQVGADDLTWATRVMRLPPESRRPVRGLAEF